MSQFVNAPLHMSYAAAGDPWLVGHTPRSAEASRSQAAGFRWAAETLSSDNLSIVRERIFGSLSVERVVMAERAAAFLARGISPDGPVTYVEGHPPWGEGLAGWIIHAVPGETLDGEPRIITDHGVPLGRAWQANGVDFVTLQNLHDGALIEGCGRKPRICRGRDRRNDGHSRALHVSPVSL